MEDIQIQDYTDKSFVVRGETRKYLENMKTLGGKWNSSLTDKTTGEKFGAWIFPSMKKKEVQKWMETREESSFDKEVQPTIKSFHIKKDEYKNNISIENIYNMLITINQRLEIIESTLNIPKTTISSSELYSSEWKIENDIDDEVPKVPMKRLLGGK
jgi:hypothetical protein